MARPHPNILLLMTDQQKATAMGLYGNPVVRTPHWDLVATEGILFETCFACSPVCGPSRASLMTGVHAPVHGVTCNSRRIHSRLPQLPELLRSKGYLTAAIGHYDAAVGLNRGWDHEVDWWDERHGLCQIFREADELARQPQPLRGWVNGVHPRSAHESLAARVTDHAIDFLERAAREPFFLHVAHVEPHPPYFPPQPYASMYDPNRIVLPARPNPESQPRWQREAAEEMRAPQATERDIRLALARYYGLISYADDQIGRLLAHMDGRGLLANTWVILASDHGDYAGEHGLFAKSEAFYDCLLRVPLIVRPPGNGFSARRGTRSAGLVQLFDLFPTICEIAGIEVPSHVQAQSLLATIDGQFSPERTAVFAAVGGSAQPRASFPQGMPRRGIHRQIASMVRTASKKLIRDPENGEEFYCLQRDPGELCCLDPRESASESAPLQDLLLHWDEECRSLEGRFPIGTTQ